MLMEIDTLPMRGSLVMTMVMISPSRREVSPAEQLRRSLRFVPPRFRLVAVEFCLVSFSHDFFQGKSLHIAEDGHRRDTRGPRRQGGAPSKGGRAPHPPGQGVGPLWYFFRSIILINSKIDFLGVSGLFELCRIRFQYLLLFQPRIPAADILPLHVNLVK